MPLLRPVAGAAALLSIALAVSGVNPTLASAAIAPASQSTTSNELQKYVVLENARISGTAKVGSALTANPGLIDPAPATWSYQWYRGDVAIAGAVSSRYVATAADRGKTLRVKTTGTADGYAPVTLTSSPTAAVAAGTFSTTRASVISGSAVVGSVLTAKSATWTPTPTTRTYRWYRSGAAISGATASKYKLVSADVGKRITVKITAAASGYTSTSSTSAATATVLRKISSAPTPVISGSAKVGSKLTAKAGRWLPSPVALKYQWYRSGKAITGATRSTYVVTRSDGGARITVKVTGRKTGYASVSKTSAATATVPKLLKSAPTPTISGKRTVTSVLTAVPGSWSPAPVKLTYQWYRSGKAITGATSSRYRLKSADAGKTITVRVRGSKSGYASVTKTSAATARIGYPGRTAPASKWNCPSWAPIKGNANSMIYHVPGARYYKATAPEECFRTESAARNAGYRRAKV